jgi:hypothetical protein
LTWRRCLQNWPWGDVDWRTGCLSPRSHSRSSWGWTSCAPMALPWIWGAKCYDWAKKRWCYDIVTPFARVVIDVAGICPLEQRWWWYVSRDWHLTRELLGASSLQEGEIWQDI